jgi:hypothetical protein
MDAIYSKNPDVVFRKIAGEFILVPIRQKAIDLKSVFTLNETGAFVWELIDGTTGVSRIKGRVAEEFEVAPVQADADVAELVLQLEALSLIQKK